MALTPIDEYEVMYSGNKFPPRIWLKHAGAFIGQLIFMPGGSTLPADSMSAGQVNLYYHLENYAHAVDLLRNEKPMFLLYTAPTAENGIRTSAEPLGEEE